MNEPIAPRIFKPDDPIKVYFQLAQSDAISVQIGFELESDHGPDNSRSHVGFDIGEPLPIAKSAEKQTIMSEGRIPGKIMSGNYSLFLHFEGVELNSRHIHSDFVIKIEGDYHAASPKLGDVSNIDVG